MKFAFACHLTYNIKHKPSDVFSYMTHTTNTLDVLVTDVVVLIDGCNILYLIDRLSLRFGEWVLLMSIQVISDDDFERNPKYHERISHYFRFMILIFELCFRCIFEHWFAWFIFEIIVVVGDCNDNVFCMNNGSCRKKGKTVMCSCETGFAGLNCEHHGNYNFPSRK